MSFDQVDRINLATCAARLPPPCPTPLGWNGTSSTCWGMIRRAFRTLCVMVERSAAEQEDTITVPKPGIRPPIISTNLRPLSVKLLLGWMDQRCDVYVRGRVDGQDLESIDNFE